MSTTERRQLEREADDMTRAADKITQAFNFDAEHVCEDRYVCGACYVGDHHKCDSFRANGESCECRRCGDLAEQGA